MSSKTWDLASIKYQRLELGRDFHPGQFVQSNVEALQYLGMFAFMWRFMLEFAGLLVM